MNERAMRTGEELNALPIGSVIRCDDLEGIGMNVAERSEEGWIFIGHGEAFTSKQLAIDPVDWTVLWGPSNRDD